MLGVFLVLYGLLHYYPYRKLKAVISIGQPYHAMILIFLLVMLLSPILKRVLPQLENPFLAVTLSYIENLWMVALFLFFFIHLLVDIYCLIIYLLSKTPLKIPSTLMPDRKVNLVFAVVLCLGIMIYGKFEADMIQIETVILKTEKLPSQTSLLRIAQISDTHFSAINGVNLAQQIVDKVEELDPDILVSTGDFADRELKDHKEVAALFRGLDIPYGKYAIMGNHEFYMGVERAVEFTESAGFRMLRDEGVTIGDLVNLVGMDDRGRRGTGFGPKPDMDEEDILRAFPSEKLTLLLKHQPIVNEKSMGLFDLQLSGHVHKGQVFPFTLFTHLAYQYVDGLFSLDGNAHLYVSRGTGTWGPPIRFLAPPEITVIEFRN